MKILLINPTTYSVYPIGNSYSEPLGLAFIASMLRENSKHSVEIIDSAGMMDEIEKVNGRLRIGIPEDELLAIIKQKNFDIIGITLLSSSSAEGVLLFIQILKDNFPLTPIIIGGPHATLEWESCIETGGVDYIVLGEGEQTIVELLDALTESGDISQVDGICYKDQNGEFIRTAPRKRIDINKIPWPARELLPMENYFRLRPRQYQMRNPAASIFTSRACPFKCTFCSTSEVWGRKWRGRNHIDVVNEIEFLVENYKVKEIIIQDDNFLVDKQRVSNICDEIIRRKINIKWKVPPGLYLPLLDKELLLKMKKSGLYIIRPQLETGNPKTLKYINKRINFDRAREIFRFANRIGLWTQTNIIIGFYFEEKEDIEKSIRFAESLNVDNVSVVNAIPYKHTQMYSDYIKAGLMKPEGQIRDSYDSLHFTAKELKKMKINAQRRCRISRLKQILNPVLFCTEFLPKINSAEKLRFFIRRIMMG